MNFRNGTLLFHIFLTAVLIVLFISSEQKQIINENQITGLQDGDLIFRRGRSAESHVVLVADSKSEFSHVGIIYIENKTPYVIHAVPGENKCGKDYIKKEKLTDFLAPKKASEYSVYRSDFPETINKNAASFANHYYQEKRVFDEKYDLSTDDKLYCTELILKVYLQATNQSFQLKTTQLKIFFGNIELLMPGNIIESAHFHSIINN